MSHIYPMLCQYMSMHSKITVFTVPDGSCWDFSGLYRLGLGYFLLLKVLRLPEKVLDASSQPYNIPPGSILSGEAQEKGLRHTSLGKMAQFLYDLEALWLKILIGL